jgi:alginate O-acetyltransferase complex protein AlgI
MLFSSFHFFLFLAGVLVVYWAIDNQRARDGVLLISSLFFYAFWYPPYIVLLIVLVTACWFSALYLTRFGRGIPILAAGAILFGALGYWKYSAFFVQILNDVGIRSPVLDHWNTSLALPLGISFIVFQGLGYVIDVAKGDKAVEPRWSTVILFKAYFPQLIAGPICRAHELIPQLKTKKNFDSLSFASGFAILAIGLFLKIVFADTIAPTVDRYFAAPSSLSGTEAWFATLGFSVQILADFWGYSTMAYGMSLMLGIVLPVNFKLPYLAKGVRDFWRRWHITLSLWLRDYLYKPLGGSRHGYARTLLALMLTMLLGGLWHGANYTYLAWGALHGLALSIEHGAVGLWGRTVGPAVTRRFVWRLVSRLSPIFAWIYAMTIVLIGWVFFRAPSIEDAFLVLGRMAKPVTFSLNDISLDYVVLVLVFFVIQIPAESLLDRLRSGKISASWCYLSGGWLLLLSAMMSADQAAPFIYFQF